MNNQWKHLAGQWKQFRDHAEKISNELSESKPLRFDGLKDGLKEVTTNIKSSNLAGQRKRLVVKARRMWRELTGSKPRKPVKYKKATMNIK